MSQVLLTPCFAQIDNSAACRIVLVAFLSLLEGWLYFAGDARLDLGNNKHSAHTLVPAMQLMRMISCSSRSGFLQRSGMLLRCVHLLRNVLAACPVPAAHLMVCMTATLVLQPPCVVLLSHAPI